VSQLVGEFSVNLFCRVVELAPSTFYYHPQMAETLELRNAIEEIALEYPRYGYRHISAELNLRGWQVNHKPMLNLMREGNLVVEVRRYCRSTTNSRHGYGRYPNLIKQVEIVRPDQVWCADLTYIRLEREFIYLAVVLDLFTRTIRGWELGRHLTEELTKTALERALQTLRPEIHHWDQGVQDAATGYVRVLEAAQVQISMAARDKPTENASAERFMRTLKEEEVSLHEYGDLNDARQHLARFLDEVYMHKHVHSSLGYMPPAEFEAQWLEQATKNADQFIPTDRTLDPCQ